MYNNFNICRLLSTSMMTVSGCHTYLVVLNYTTAIVRVSLPRPPPAIRSVPLDVDRPSLRYIITSEVLFSEVQVTTASSQILHNQSCHHGRCLRVPGLDSAARLSLVRLSSPTLLEARPALYTRCHRGRTP